LIAEPTMPGSGFVVEEPFSVRSRQESPDLILISGTVVAGTSWLVAAVAVRQMDSAHGSRMAWERRMDSDVSLNDRDEVLPERRAAVLPSLALDGRASTACVVGRDNGSMHCEDLWTRPEVPFVSGCR